MKRMLTKVYQMVFVILITGIVIFAACQQKEQATLVPDNYRSWNKLTHTVLDYPIPGHESNFRVIYINAVGENVQTREKNNRVFYEYPEGTIIVKEIYEGLKHPEEGEKPIMLDIIIKNPQHPQSRGGWLWILKDLNTQEERIIDYEFCVDCHANANESHPYGDENPNGDFRDYVYFPPVVTHP